LDNLGEPTVEAVGPTTEAVGPTLVSGVVKPKVEKPKTATPAKKKEKNKSLQDELFALKNIVKPKKETVGPVSTGADKVVKASGRSCAPVSRK
jgi:hypothetical protein